MERVDLVAANAFFDDASAAVIRVIDDRAILRWRALHRHIRLRFAVAPATATFGCASAPPSMFACSPPHAPTITSTKTTRAKVFVFFISIGNSRELRVEDDGFFAFLCFDDRIERKISGGLHAHEMRADRKRHAAAPRPCRACRRFDRRRSPRASFGEARHAKLDHACAARRCCESAPHARKNKTKTARVIPIRSSPAVSNQCQQATRVDAAHFVESRDSRMRAESHISKEFAPNQRSSRRTCCTARTAHVSSCVRSSPITPSGRTGSRTQNAYQMLSARGPAARISSVTIASAARSVASRASLHSPRQRIASPGPGNGWRHKESARDPEALHPPRALRL